MMLRVCPTEVVRASPDRIWDLLTTPRELAAWSETKLVEAPERELRAGDRLMLAAGRGWFRVTFHVRDVQRPRLLSIHIRLPFGVINEETIHVSPIGSSESRVTFN